MDRLAKSALACFQIIPFPLPLPEAWGDFFLQYWLRSWWRWGSNTKLPVQVSLPWHCSLQRFLFLWVVILCIRVLVCSVLGHWFANLWHFSYGPKNSGFFSLAFFYFLLGQSGNFQAFSWHAKPETRSLRWNFLKCGSFGSQSLRWKWLLTCRWKQVLMLPDGMLDVSVM